MHGRLNNNASVMITSISHLTINTNDLRMSPRAEVSADAIRVLLPWTKGTKNKATRLPVLPLYARAHRGDGLAQLDIWSAPPNAHQVAQAVLVWTPEAEARVWPRVLDQSREAGIIAAVLRKPASIPWLAAAITQAATVLDPDTLMALADLERCWAWAVLETEAL
jgi:hypothetical protein